MSQRGRHRANVRTEPNNRSVPRPGAAPSTNFMRRSRLQVPCLLAFILVLALSPSSTAQVLRALREPQTGRSTPRAETGRSTSDPSNSRSSIPAVRNRIFERSLPVANRYQSANHTIPGQGKLRSSLQPGYSAMDWSVRSEPPGPASIQKMGHETLAPQLRSSGTVNLVSPNPVAHKQIAQPWWQHAIERPLMNRKQPVALSISAALQAASGAPEIAALRADVDRRRAELLGQESTFDWTAFADTTFNRDNVPVGSSLDGATNRLRERTWDLQAGLRNTNRSGGAFSIYHEFGFLHSNSRFLTPPTQGTGRVTAEYTHPLMRASGETYNTGLIAIAGKRIAQSDASLLIGTEDHLLRVAHAYWGLVLARGETVLANRAWARTSTIVEYMNRRRDVDVGRNQLLQATAANAARQTKWIEATYEVLRAQERLLRLMHQLSSPVEIVTTSRPSVSESTAAAFPDDLAQHPQIAAARQAVQASSIELNLARADLQPKLDLVLSAYSAGLHGGGKFHRASQLALSDSEPGFGVGFNFEYPLGNRRAHAQVDRSDAQLRRLQHQFEVVVSDVSLNIRDRSIGVEKASAVLAQSSHALSIAEQDLKSIQTRRDLLIDGSNIGELYLDALLRSQDRLHSAERRVLLGQIEMKVALFNLRHARGELRQRITTGARNSR
jgi:outer membrane protein TolC